ncbi:hypothetical protein [Yoonia litorea]|uniref:Uncharacterized protein n=1 Tax=Yoonia litorea TaxID=1123755 RepID=A0A1I6M0R5_9RHOB|nr:hypothetical protein [Yoonia litorea]SFS09218.1 hypothetical protein SAMN05444714_1099 [Yoonia litorea]
MAHRKQDINDFNARVKRINSPRNKSYFDPDLGMHVPKRVPRDKIKKAKVREESSFLALFIVSAVLGAFGYFAAQVIRVRYIPEVDTAMMALTVDLLVALWVVAMVTALTNKRSLFDRLSQAVGIYAMVVAGHNLIWRWPEQMAMIYTPEHVQYVMATTTEMSVIVGASTYTF